VLFVFLLTNSSEFVDVHSRLIPLMYLTVVMQNLVLVVCVCVQVNVADSSHSSSASATGVDYESVVLMRLRQAEERKRLNDQLNADDDPPT